MPFNRPILTNYLQVYEGQYDGHKVAVKVWTAEAADNTSNQREERQQQLEGLLLSLMEHANIIKTYKVCTEQQEPDDKDSSASGMGLEVSVASGCNRNEEHLPCWPRAHCTHC